MFYENVNVLNNNSTLPTWTFQIHLSCCQNSTSTWIEWIIFYYRLLLVTRAVVHPSAFFRLHRKVPSKN